MRAEPVMMTLNGAASLNLASTSAGAATGSACISCSGRSMVGPPRRAVGGGPCWGEGGGGERCVRHLLRAVRQLLQPLPRPLVVKLRVASPLKTLALALYATRWKAVHLKTW